MCAWVPPGMCLKMNGRTTLRKHHDFDQIFSFGKHEKEITTSNLEEIWQMESRTTVSKSQNKDIEKFWHSAKLDSQVLKKNLCMEDAAANRLLFSTSDSKNALRFEDEARPQLSHYKSNFNKSVLTTPKAVKTLNYGRAEHQAKQNKALGKQSSVCLAYY